MIKYLDKQGCETLISHIKELIATGGTGEPALPDPRALKALIAECTTIHDEAYTENADPTFHTWKSTTEAIQALQAAIDKAQGVVDGYGTTVFKQSELNAAKAELQAALETFKSASTEALPNLTEFEALKARVKAVDDTAHVSVNGKEITFGETWVTAENKATAAAAVQTAEAAVKAATKQSEIDAACDTLEAAVQAYEKSVVTAAADNAGIDAAIEAAQKLREGVIVSADGEGLDPGIVYVSEQQILDTMDAAIEAATEAKSSATTQQMLDDATATLTEATGVFDAALKYTLNPDIMDGPQLDAMLEAMDDAQIEETLGKMSGDAIGTMLSKIGWKNLATFSSKATTKPEMFSGIFETGKKIEKTIALTGISGVTDVKVRLIGIGKDVDASGSKLGFTFQLCDGLAVKQPAAMRMNASNTTSGGWEKCEMRTTNLPKLEAALPEDLKAVMKTMKKKTNMTNSGSTLKETTDKLALLSSTEVFGDDQSPNSDTTQWCKGEGEWYQYYENNNTVNNRIINNNSGSAEYWWLRSVYSTTSFSMVGKTGRPVGTNASLDYLPCACFCV